MPEENETTYRGLDDWITVKEAAEIMAVSERTVRYHCKEKNIKCRKFGETNIWQVDKYDAEHFHRRSKSKREESWSGKF